MNTKITIFSALICGITTSILAMQSSDHQQKNISPHIAPHNIKQYPQGRNCVRRLILPCSIDRTLLTDDINLDSEDFTYDTNFNAKDIAERLFGINFEESDSKK